MNNLTSHDLDYSSLHLTDCFAFIFADAHRVASWSSSLLLLLVLLLNEQEESSGWGFLRTYISIQAHTTEACRARSISMSNKAPACSPTVRSLSKLPLGLSSTMKSARLALSVAAALLGMAAAHYKTGVRAFASSSSSPHVGSTLSVSFPHPHYSLPFRVAPVCPASSPRRKARPTAIT